MKEALKHDILVAGGACVVDTPEAVCAARGDGGIGGDVPRVLLNGVGEELVMLSLTTY